MKTGQRKHEQATVEIALSEAIPEEMRDGVREVLRLYVPSHHRKKGLAQALMRSICEEADKESKVLMLWPRMYGDGEMESVHLIAWYQTFGFVVTQEAPVLMMRKPRVQANPLGHIEAINRHRRELLSRAVSRALH